MPMLLQLLFEFTVPLAELKNQYKISLYYTHGKPLCFIVESVRKQYVDVGFCKGNQVQIHKEYRVIENRKMMISLRYKALEEIEDAVFVDVLLEAKRLC